MKYEKGLNISSIILGYIMAEQDVMNTYRSFLDELHKASQSNKDLQKTFETMIEQMEDVDENAIKSSDRIHNFLDFMDGILEKRSVFEWEKICKDIHKRNNKAHKIFFLHTPAQAKDANIGSIALDQPENSPHIQDYLYIIYCHVCHLLYGEPDSITCDKRKQHYSNVLSFFEEKENNGGNTKLPEIPADMDIMGTYNNVLENVDGLDGKELVNMVFDNANNPMIGMFSSFLKDSVNLDEVRSEVEKLDKEDVSSILKDIREKMKDLDLSKIMSDIQTMDPSNLGDSIKNIQESLFSKERK